MKHTPAAKPVAETWFSIEAYAGDILRFREHNIDAYASGDFWLVRGNDEALVVDTGCGIVSPAGLVNAVAGRPVTAVALNCYYDHAGGWAAFDARACHPLDAPCLEAPEEENVSVNDYLNHGTLWALPWAGYDVMAYAMTPARPTRLVDEGDVFDLGGRCLEVLRAPGREPGGIVVWEAATGSLFTSDMLYDGEHGPAWPPENPTAYAATLERMRDLPVSRVYPGHYGAFGRARMLALIDEQLADLNDPRREKCP